MPPEAQDRSHGYWLSPMRSQSLLSEHPCIYVLNWYLHQNLICNVTRVHDIEISKRRSFGFSLELSTKSFPANFRRYKLDSGVVSTCIQRMYPQISSDFFKANVLRGLLVQSFVSR